MEIRNVSLQDLEALTKLFNQYRVWYNQKSDVEGSFNFLSARLSNKDSEIFVCEYENDLIGFIQLYPLFSSTRMKKLWLLNDLFVNEKFRGKGIAIQLIDRAKDLVKNTKACAMFLETDKTNEIGNYLYPRVGFEMNKHSNYYEWSHA